MSEQPRDWDKELADIDKAMERLPAQPPAPGVPPARPTPPAPGGGPVTPPRRGAATAATWLKTLLAVALAVAIPFWPYGHACGPALFLYFGAIGMTIVAGLWSAVSAWRVRSATAHVLSLAAVLTGLVVGALTILPRIGYAREAAPWLCP